LIVVAGAPGSGKSTLIARHCANASARGIRLVIADPTGDLSRYIAAELGTADGITVLATAKGWAGPLPDAGIVVFHATDAADFLACGDAWITAAASLESDTIYACDEAELLFPNTPYSQDARGSRRAAILTIARNRDCQVVLATKRPQRLHVDARDNALRVCVFRADSTRFADGCANFGDVLDYAPARRLADGEYLYRPPGGAAERGGLRRGLTVHDSRGPIPFGV
jgi:hypothetical protein